ncbi:MAG: YkgJ family cysteine cluster protein [Oscillospiraceae bacterium]|nr:YkgJ family cysteine cluster protein [Oscillospiraceae bacterium]
MADQLPIHYDLRPAYYDRFQCLAGACRFSCCKGWNITFNKKDYLALKRQEGSDELTANLTRNVRRIRQGPNAGRFYGEFDMSGGTCPLLREDGLCSLQLEKGHGALPEVCRVFPRTQAYSDSGYLERRLTPACEAVLELLWDLPDGVDFVADPLPKSKTRTLIMGTSGPLRLRFQELRSACIDLLQDRRRPLAQRILLMGLALKELADGEEDVDGWLARTRTLADDPETDRRLQLPDQQKTLSMFLTNNIRVMLASQSPNRELSTVLKEVLDGLGAVLTFEGGQAVNFSLPNGPYLAARARFEENFQDRAYFMENLMVTLFFNLQVPDPVDREKLWKSYVDFCNLYSFFRFMAVASCREGAAGDKAELFRMMVCASRGLMHNTPQKAKLRDEFFQNDSATLAHMAILLCG